MRNPKNLRINVTSRIGDIQTTQQREQLEASKNLPQFKKEEAVKNE